MDGLFQSRYDFMSGISSPYFRYSLHLTYSDSGVQNCRCLRKMIRMEQRILFTSCITNQQSNDVMGDHGSCVTHFTGSANESFARFVFANNRLTPSRSPVGICKRLRVTTPDDICVPESDLDPIKSSRQFLTSTSSISCRDRLVLNCDISD